MKKLLHGFISLGMTVGLLAGGIPAANAHSLETSIDRSITVDVNNQLTNFTKGCEKSCSFDASLTSGDSNNIVITSNATGASVKAVAPGSFTVTLTATKARSSDRYVTIWNLTASVDPNQSVTFGWSGEGAKYTSGTWELKETQCDANQTPYLVLRLKDTSATFANVSVDENAAMSRTKVDKRGKATFEYTYTPGSPIDIASLLNSLTVTHNDLANRGKFEVENGCIGEVQVDVCSVDTTGMPVFELGWTYEWPTLDPSESSYREILPAYADRGGVLFTSGDAWLMDTLGFTSPWDYISWAQTCITTYDAQILKLDDTAWTADLAGGPVSAVSNVEGIYMDVLTEYSESGLGVDLGNFIENYFSQTKFKFTYTLTDGSSIVLVYQAALG